MNFRKLPLIVSGAMLASSGLASDSVNFWSAVGNIGGPIFWVGGLGSSLVQDGHLGLDHAARTADGFIVAVGLSEGAQYVFREKRPYTNSLDSFPSTHATASFEIAAAQSYYHPKQAIFWYAGATLIAYSRIPSHDHHWQDIIAGAALGYGAGQLSVSSKHGWLIAPLVESGRLGGSAMYSTKF